MYNIKRDYSKDALFDELGLRRLRDSYMMPEETSPQDRFAKVVAQFASNQKHAERVYSYVANQQLSLSTPILAFGRTKNSLPISCYLSYLPDTSEGLVNTLQETCWLSMGGGGIGIHIDIRSSDSKSVGVMRHLKVYEMASMAFKQNSTRRGSYAAYLDLTHPDIIQFIEMRKPTGDPHLRATRLNHGVNIPDKFMKIIERCMIDPSANDDWELIQPNTGKVVEVVSAKYLWQLILETRMETGEPYIWFIDTANAALPQYQKDMGLKIHGSNLCSEISLATSPERTAVCCLSSINLEYYDEISTNQHFLKDVLEFLDNVLQYFIDHAPDSISRARYSAMRERSVGVGALGFHAYLQKKGIAFESASAKSANIRMFKHIRKGLDKANRELAEERGPCPDAEGKEMKRCSHVMAIAPNASTSIIMGNTSPSIEPFPANAYRQDTISGAYVTKNRFLDVVIRRYQTNAGKDDRWYNDVWSSIISNDGSVQHLEFLSEHERMVFKTAREIDQRWIIEYAGDRQVYIDQAQSVNVYFKPTVSIKMLHAVHFKAWKMGLKGLYYCRSTKLRNADAIGSQIERKRIIEEPAVDLTEIINNEECLACEG